MVRILAENQKELAMPHEGPFVVLVIGVNGSGKTTLSNILAGRDGYTVTQGDILFFGENLVGAFNNPASMAASLRLIRDTFLPK